MQVGLTSLDIVECAVLRNVGEWPEPERRVQERAVRDVSSRH